VGQIIECILATEAQARFLYSLLGCQGKDKQDLCGKDCCPHKAEIDRFKELHIFDVLGKSFSVQQILDVAHCYKQHFTRIYRIYNESNPFIKKYSNILHVVTC